VRVGASAPEQGSRSPADGGSDATDPEDLDVPDTTFALLTNESGPGLGQPTPASARPRGLSRAFLPPPETSSVARA
jgi:hypothetical protein